MTLHTSQIDKNIEIELLFNFLNRGMLIIYVLQYNCKI